MIIGDEIAIHNNVLVLVIVILEGIIGDVGLSTHLLVLTLTY
jgi:hypothetical protein